MFQKFSEFQYDLKKLVFQAITLSDNEKATLVNTLSAELLHEETVTSWTDAQGDYTHRLKYDLDQNSVVLDVGGFRGEWAASIFCLYDCNIHVFEPIRGYVDIIQKKFGGNPKIKVHDFGLARNTGKFSFNYLEDGTSQFKNSDRKVEGKLVDIVQFINDNEISSVDLMKLNVEGAEYELLDRLIETGYMGMFKHVQIQFHNFVPNAISHRQQIQEKLKETHTQTYNYDFVWEGWTRK